MQAFFLLIFLWFSESKTTIVFEHKVSNKNIRIGFYTKEASFLDDKGLIFYKILPATGNKTTVNFDLSEYPEVAFAAFIDENNNSKLDKNLVGFPTEPFGFSNNIRPSFKAPSFKACKFTPKVYTKSMLIRLEN